MSQQELLKLIDSKAYKFTGSYDLTNLSKNPNKNSAALTIEIDKNPNNYNLLVDRFFYHNEFNNPNDNIKKIMELGELYNITSFSQPANSINLDSEIIGYIVFAGLYPDTYNQDPQPGITSGKKLIKFGASNTFGIYEDIKYVIIDFREPTRKVYFF